MRASNCPSTYIDLYTMGCTIEAPSFGIYLQVYIDTDSSQVASFIFDEWLERQNGKKFCINIHFRIFPWISCTLQIACSFLMNDCIDRIEKKISVSIYTFEYTKRSGGSILHPMVYRSLLVARTVQKWKKGYFIINKVSLNLILLFLFFNQ